MIRLPILATSLHFSLKGWKNVLFELIVGVKEITGVEFLIEHTPGQPDSYEKALKRMQDTKQNIGRP